MKTMDFAEEMFPPYTYNPSEYESRETHISNGGKHTFKNCLCILSLSLDAHKIENIQKQFLHLLKDAAKQAQWMAFSDK